MNPNVHGLHVIAIKRYTPADSEIHPPRWLRIRQLGFRFVVVKLQPKVKRTILEGYGHFPFKNTPRRHVTRWGLINTLFRMAVRLLLELIRHLLCTLAHPQTSGCSKPSYWLLASALLCVP